MARYGRSFPGKIIIERGPLSSASTLLNGLVAYYKFDENTGSTVNDSTANANTGTWNGTLGSQWTSSGKINSAGVFNGGNNYVNIPDSSSLGFTTGVSVEAWAYFTTVNVNNQLVSKRSSWGSTTIPFELTSTGSPNVKFSWRVKGNGNILTGTTTIVANTWYHIVGTWDGTTQRLYVNGVQEASALVSGSITTNSTPVSIGQLPSGGGESFTGRIDEVGIWSRGLTAAEVTSLYNSGAGLQYSFSSSATTTKIATGVSRITGTTLKTETGITRITATTLKTETGITRITGTTTKTETGIANIKNTTLKTETGISRITQVTPKTETGISRITAITTKTLSGVSNIKATTVKTESGISRITNTTTKTETGISRIGLITTKTLPGISRITASTSKTESGISRITNTSNKTETGIARITNTSIKTETGTSRITAITLKTESGVSRITVTTTKTLTGVSNIVPNSSVTSKTLNGISRISSTVTYTPKIVMVDGRLALRVTKFYYIFI